MKVEETYPSPALGRPIFDKADPVCSRLLRAATELFANHDFRTVSIRQIAAKAGVNTAMIHYYFGNKRGLYLTMLEQFCLHTEETLLHIAIHDDISITEFISSYTEVLMSDSWYPLFLIREGILGDGPIRAAATDKIVSVLAPAMLRALENENKNGRLRKDLDLKLLSLTLSSLVLFPFIMRPLVEKSLDFTFDSESIKRLILHSTDVFLHGVCIDDETQQTKTVTE